ncbi:PduJ-like protein clustered with choline trimethylamine-lyase / EutM/PduA/PduJ-like protein 3 clustered with choline trimethylamine-lyase [Desulfovibrio diazotrophicus]|nr:PduJ-like protein clustered with choline trimethylamine-lyase / EutM/PduA/PduJ-like protein 3 clustered with choline trimethylamine-lyase [Desulfovibrio diazotrophicus]VVU42700.1 PduJ-like protein clustered with choline trimethylamine-lyase / EutM/PduA/PduJ-like protein 3 clustered with choline trimethylamine-lyase [Desulfovibrio diazotrophicus]
MQYRGEEALGLIETLGMVPAIYGADSMLKAADVELVGYENVGSTLVTIMVKGDVAAVRASVAAGAAAAASVGKLTAQNVMPRPVRGVGGIVRAHALDAVPEDDPGLRALGMIETFGIVFLMEGADAMIKAADVELIGYENVASGYCSALTQGDVAACEAAVAAGVSAVHAMGAEVYSRCVIPTPHPHLVKLVRRYVLP